MNVILRQEQKKDYRTVEELIREAFWNLNVPGCSEHYLAHILRKNQAFVPRLDFVAVADNQIVGNIMYAKSQILNDDGSKMQVLTFGPLAVLPEYQRQGVGKMLVNHTIDLAQKMGYQAILIFGNPKFYERFGFVPAQRFHIGTAWDTYADALQALELVPDALADCSGRFFEGECYDVNEKDVQEFDKTFAPKTKEEGLPSQLLFMEQLKKNTPRK